MCPKLKDAHFNLSAYGAKMRVSLATQVLSHSVAVGISTHASLGRLEPEAQHTAQALELLNNLQDSFNSSTVSGIHISKLL